MYRYMCTAPEKESIKLTTSFLLVASVFAVVLAVAQLLATDALFLSRAQELGVGA